MKTKITALLLLLLVLALAMFSCGAGGDASGNGGEGSADGGGADDINKEYGVSNAVLEQYKDHLYGGGIVPFLVLAEGVTSDVSGAIYQGMKVGFGSVPSYYNDTGDEKDHEIIIGDSTRAVSRKAMRILNRSEYNGTYDVGYVIYASGNSIAIVYDEKYNCAAAFEAIDYFLNEIVAENESVKLTSGVVHHGVVDMLEKNRELDAESYLQHWERVRNEIVTNYGEEHADDVVAALKDHYDSYNMDVVTWIANLYDPGVGGFYYSNSARNNAFYAPDVESTAQALGLLSAIGSMGGKSWKGILSEQTQAEIGVYIKSLQDPNGYFYNYQWEKSTSDMHPSRLSRDLNNAVGILSSLGLSPTYNTPTGKKGDGVVVEGTYDPTPLMQLTPAFGTQSAVVAASNVVAVSAYNSKFENMDALNEYLDGLANSSRGFYSIGNEITSAMSQIKAQDSKLRNEFNADPANEGKPYPSMVNRVIEWFNEHQDPTTGLWGHDAIAPASYGTVNGLLKISGVYNAAMQEIPYAEKAAQAAIDAISSDERIGAVVDLYNTWFAVKNVINNIRTCNISAEDENGNLLSPADRIKAIRANLMEGAVHAIRKSTEKISAFAKEDGSFSYTRAASSATSQGLPVAVPGTNEGDVNATVISITGLTGNMFEALGIGSVPMFGRAELCILQEIIDNLGPVIKPEIDARDDVPYSFDDETVGSPTVSITIGMPGGDGIVTKHTEEGKEGNYLKVTGTTGGGSVFVNSNSADRGASCYVFETDMRIHSDVTTKTYLFQITIGNSYMLAVHVKDGGIVRLTEETTTSWSTSRSTFLAEVKTDEWFNVRVEYFKFGNNGEQRAVIYVNGEMVAVTDGFYGMNHDKKTDKISGEPQNGNLNMTKIYKMQACTMDVDFDNLYCGSMNKLYEVPNDPDGKLAHNVDKDAAPAPEEE